jgi:hypothetical protein
MRLRGASPGRTAARAGIIPGLQANERCSRHGCEGPTTLGAIMAAMNEMLETLFAKVRSLPVQLQCVIGANGKRNGGDGARRLRKTTITRDSTEGNDCLRAPVRR